MSSELYIAQGQPGTYVACHPALFLLISHLLSSGWIKKAQIICASAVKEIENNVSW